MDLLNCPHCDANLDGGDIFEYYATKHPELSADKVREWAGMYGWSDKDKKRFSRMIGITDLHLDRVVEYKCPDCGKTWPRDD